ncbi:MAG: hypothetical protein PHP25_03375 [Candidatus Moranbacteria bacterium]|nr:hypothetical protein [Candidatus Moranbacteria bacterium]
MAKDSKVEYVPCPIKGCDGKMPKGEKMCSSCSREGMQPMSPVAEEARQ